MNENCNMSTDQIRRCVKESLSVSYNNRAAFLKKSYPLFQSTYSKIYEFLINVKDGSDVNNVIARFDMMLNMMNSIDKQEIDFKQACTSVGHNLASEYVSR